jgi:ribosomal protein S18 acetylase RimI-like enzyme
VDAVQKVIAMSKAVTIRALGVAETQDYRAIRLAALRHAPEAFGSVHDIEALKSTAQHSERLISSVVFGAYDGNSIVGMIGLKQEDGPKDRHKAFMWGFYVDPVYRNDGVGAAMLAALLATARDLVEQVTLAVVRDSTAAIALYERFGFTRYGIEPRALKTDAGYADEVLMVRFLMEENQSPVAHE